MWLQKSLKGNVWIHKVRFPRTTVLKSHTCYTDKKSKSHTYFTNFNSHLPALLQRILLKITLTLLFFCLWCSILSHYAYKIHEGGKK